jgi:hypothetical protein
VFHQFFNHGLALIATGQSTAYQWYAAGCRSLDDLKAGKGGVTLTPAQKIGIQFYDGELLTIYLSFLDDRVFRH